MLTQIFKTAFFVYTKTFKYVLLISLFVNIPKNSMILFMPDRWAINLDILIQMDVMAMLPFMLISYIISILFEPLTYAGFTYLARGALADENLSLTGVLDNTLLKWPALLATSLLYYVFLIIGSILIIPAIYVIVVFTFYVMVVVDRDRYGFAALLESARIVKGNFFKTLLVLMLISVLSMIFGSFVGYTIFFQNDFVNRLLNIITFTLRDTYVAYFSIVTVMYYFCLTKLKGDANAS